MLRRFWNRSFGKFNSTVFWRDFSSSFGTALGLGGLFVLPMMILAMLALR